MLEKIDPAPARHPVPYYGSYASFLRGVKALKDYGIPKRINPRSLPTILGEEASRISSGFTAMGWIDHDGRPTQQLLKLVAAFGEESWKEALTEIVRKNYSFVPGDWEDLTSDRLHDAFVAYTGREAKVMTSAETFFLSLALECGVHLPDRLYLRASRAHSEARRPKPDEDDEVSEPLALEGKRVDALKLPESVKSESAPANQRNEWMDKVVRTSAIISELSELMTDPRVTVQEKQGIATTIAVLAKRMNAT